MAQERPPSLDPVAASRWAMLPLAKGKQARSLSSPWLHEEVARRMEERLAFITLQPQSWVCWDPVRGRPECLGFAQTALSQGQGLFESATAQRSRASANMGTQAMVAASRLV